MNYVFYITNHGFGHASRNVPIIMNILNEDSNVHVFVKSDKIRCDFMKRNLKEYVSRITYITDCQEIGLILEKGKMCPDLLKMKQDIEKDFLHWNGYINREIEFLRENKVAVVIADIIPWALKAAKICGVPSILIGNFNWSEMYKSYYGEEIWKPYSDCYEMADQAIWYEIHAEELHQYCHNYECVSLVSRAVNQAAVKKIKSNFSQDIVFVSLGGSAEIERPICVENLPYDFLVTRGIKLVGKNVYELPRDMINTPDYIAASKYVIAKGGWSTIAEILLQRKKCALLFRGENTEDNTTKAILERRQQCIAINEEQLNSMENILENLDVLQPDSYDIYVDDTEKISRMIARAAKNYTGESSR